MVDYLTTGEMEACSAAADRLLTVDDHSTNRMLTPGCRAELDALLGKLADARAKHPANQARHAAT